MSATRRALTSALLAGYLGAAAPLHSQAQTERARASAEARGWIDSGRPDLAVPIYRSLLESTPDDPRLLLNLAVSQFKAGDYLGAIDTCGRLLALDPTSGPALLFLGASHFQLAEPARAVGPLQRVVAAQPNERNARLMLAESLALLERHEEALRHFETGASLLPREPRAWYGLNQAYRHTSRAAFGRLHARFPDSAYSRAALGRSYEAQSDYRQAAYEFRSALEGGELDPHARARVMSSLAAIYRRLGVEGHQAGGDGAGENSTATDCAENDPACLFVAGRFRESRAASRSGTSARSLFWLSEAGEALADEAFERLMELPPSFQLFELRARRDSRQGNHRSAAGHWREALALDPENRVLKTGLASALFDSQDFEAAVKALDPLLDADGSSADLLLMRGSARLALNQPEEAIPDLLESAKLASETGAALAELGRAYLLADRPDQAIPPLQQILDDDEDGSYHYRLAVAYSRTGQADRAAIMLERFRQLKAAAEEWRRDLEKRLALPEGERGAAANPPATGPGRLP